MRTLMRSRNSRQARVCMLASLWPAVGAMTIPSQRSGRSLRSRHARLYATTAEPSSFRNHLLEVSDLKNSFAVLRHGQSKANVAGVIAASPELALEEYGLSEVGRQQAIQAGQDLVNDATTKPTVAIIASDLLRAKETAEIAAEAVRAATDHILHADGVILDARLRERGFGDWDGGPDVHYQDVWKDDALDDCHTLCGVESVMSVMDRATRCVLDYDDTIDDATIVCVAHGDVLQILQTAFLKQPGTKHRTMPHLETATLRAIELQADINDKLN